MVESCKTKIIATLGDPKISTFSNGIFRADLTELRSKSYDPLIELIANTVWPTNSSPIGADIIRLNLAHIGDGDSKKKQVYLVKKKYRAIKASIMRFEKKTGRRLSILVDLPGPKIRVKADDGDWYLPEKKLTIVLGEQKESFSTNPNSLQNESTVRVNIGNDPFASVNSEIAHSILKKLKELTSDRSRERPLAYIGDSDCTLFVDDVSQKKLEIYCTVHDFRRKDRLIGTHKGFTVRGVPKGLRAFTPEDKRKLGALIEEDLVASDGDNRLVSFIGISFCQSRNDVKHVLYHTAKTLKKHGLFRTKSWEYILAHAPALIAKIETKEGADNIDEILDLADGAMIARGDLALEAPMTAMPTVSKNVMEACHMRGKPVIVATQMLESMKNSIECTRPEATDVFNAVVDGADAIMLSGETSSGMYPAHAIRKMRELAISAEQYLEYQMSRNESRFSQGYAKKLAAFNERTRNIKGHYRKIYTKIYFPELTTLIDNYRKSGNKDLENEYEQILRFLEEVFRIKERRLANQPSTDKITHAACLMSADDTIAGIVAPTTSGRTARMLARFRPQRWILAQPHTEFVARKLSIVWGTQVGKVIDVQYGAQEIHALMINSAVQMLEDFPIKNKSFIFICGTPLGKVGATNLIQRWDPNTVNKLCELARE